MTNSKPRILLVEDDPNFGSVLKNYLELNEYDVNLCPDGFSGYDQFVSGKYEICILDVMMPRKDGFTLAREIREKNPQIPIIFLTAKTMKEDMLSGFKVGADDYITKPFDSEVLLYKLKADPQTPAPKKDSTHRSGNSIWANTISTSTTGRSARALTRKNFHRK